ncbi:hypothetical protein PGT21_026261 [Puccinia graminis f. sp. tritici]|uniref:Secreted protein n=1 Tax=Puccinia graminis f. sp. tritici TaxID=56615 RepID=A0A5B0RC66_PUCGR|nr:hypothetical protein PGT21_026261 [Puccinia graminis f. sp. tritici]KAA1123431.1 hypothetical protein PGTUg99_005203 [Puccinia graminis f. sp. tritici]
MFEMRSSMLSARVALASVIIAATLCVQLSEARHSLVPRGVSATCQEGLNPSGNGMLCLTAPGQSYSCSRCNSGDDNGIFSRMHWVHCSANNNPGGVGHGDVTIVETSYFNVNHDTKLIGVQGREEGGSSQTYYTCPMSSNLQRPTCTDCSKL